MRVAALVPIGLLLPAVFAAGQQPPAAIQADVKQGIEALQHGDFSSAEEHFSRALQADSNMTEVRANLGLAYYAHGKYRQAIEALALALRQNPSLTIPHTFLPLSLAAVNRCQEAVPGLRREFASEPDTKLRRIIGLSLQRCLQQAGDQPEADQVIQKLLAQYPDDTDVLFEAGQMYAKLSSQIYLRLMKIAPHSPRGYQLTGEVAAAEGNWEGAMDAYRRALKLDPALPGAHLRLAVLMLEHSPDANAWRQAIEELNAELRTNPSNAEARYEIGEAYRKHGEIEHAIASFQRALEANPDFVQARVALAKAYRQLGRKQDALSTLEPARQAAPDDARVHFLLAQLYKDLGRPVDAQREEEAFRRLQRPSQAN